MSCGFWSRRASPSPPTPTPMPQKELLPNTGYVHGGCSPVGMRKQYPTVFHETAEILDTITVSAGKIGYQVELAPSDLIALVGGTTADLTV